VVFYPILNLIAVNTLSYKTLSVRKEDVQRRWFIVDAEGQVLGRMASRIATVLRGKHRPEYTPHVDTGEYVIVINCEKVKLTGTKDLDKIYQSYSGYPGGLKELTANQVRDRKPERIIEQAVKGMLPKNKLGNAMIHKLWVYKGPDHPHAAQKPEPLI
jgi:large subunit ribosomal protein L13